MQKFIKSLFLAALSAAFCFDATSQGHCCVVQQQQFNTSIFSPASMEFISNECLVINKQTNLFTASYDPTTCIFNTPTAFPLTYTSFGSATVTKPGCQHILTTDPANNALHVYEVANCQIVNELSSIPLAGAGRLGTNNSCVAVIGSTGGSLYLQFYSVQPDCSLIPTSNFPVSGAFGFATPVLSPSTSSCSFVVFPGLFSAGNSFAFLPLTNCSATAADVVIIPGARSLAAAISPDGTCVAIATQTTLQIYTINTSNCTLNTPAIQTINSGGLGVAYSADGTCLALSGFTALQTYPVNSDCTLNTADVQNILNPVGRVAYSLADSSCKLLALTQNSVPANTTIYTVPSLQVTKSAEFIGNDKVRFTIDITNTNPVNMTNLTFSDFFPGKFKLLCSSGNGWVISQNGQFIGGSLTSLPAGATSQVILDLKVSCKNEILGNTVTVNGTADSCPVSASAFAAITCPEKCPVSK